MFSKICGKRLFVHTIFADFGHFVERDAAGKEPVSVKPSRETFSTVGGLSIDDSSRTGSSMGMGSYTVDWAGSSGRLERPKTIREPQNLFIINWFILSR